LGEFKGEDKILTLYKSGDYRLTNFDLSTHFDDDLIHIEKWHPERPLSVVYFDGEKELHYCKRFLCEVTTDKKVCFISESEGSQLDLVSTAYKPKARIIYNKLLKATKNLPDTEVDLADFIDVKGMKAQGNQMTKLKVKEIILDHSIEGEEEPWPELEASKEETLEVDKETTEEEAPTSMEWHISKKDDDDPDQVKMF
jgi:topoisomerase-4 subunit A